MTAASRPAAAPLASAAAAVAAIRSGDVVVGPLLPGGATQLLTALCARLGELENITLIIGDLEGHHTYLDAIPPGAARHLKLLLIAGRAPRRRDIRVDWAPLPLYEVAQAFRQGTWRADVVLLHLTPPDASGLHRITPTLAWLADAARVARVRLAEVSPRLPHLGGDNGITPADLTAWIESDTAPEVAQRRPVDDLARAIGRHVATLVDNGAILQLGLGSMVEALLAELIHHRDLGLHTGSLPEGVLPLLTSGVLTNRHNPHAQGVFHTMSVRGSADLYRAVDGDPRVVLKSAAFLGDPHVIAALPCFTAINGALAVDLYGQVDAETLAGRFLTNGGGQMDYARAARLSPGGRSIIMLASTGGRDQGTRIVPRLAAGDLVTTHRADVDFVVTEYGVADLRRATLAERAARLIAIAHPDHRDALHQASRDATSG